jgi:hypothetical protein
MASGFQSKRSSSLRQRLQPPPTRFNHPNTRQRAAAHRGMQSALRPDDPRPTRMPSTPRTQRCETTLRSSTPRAKQPHTPSQPSHKSPIHRTKHHIRADRSVFRGIHPRPRGSPCRDHLTALPPPALRPPPPSRATLRYAACFARGFPVPSCALHHRSACVVDLVAERFVFR